MFRLDERRVLNARQSSYLQFEFNGTGVELFGAYRANHVRALPSPRGAPADLRLACRASTP
jgi:hypothetical protein